MGMGSSRKSNGPRGLVADINVTPLVDVMLVLLIIFMVTAPMMTQGLDVNLPKTTASELKQKEEPLIISIDKTGKKIMLDKIEYSQTVLREQLTKFDAKVKEEQPIYFKADKDVPYGVVAQIMADAKSAGFKNLSLVTLPNEEKQ